jgi:hypothetical protein
MFHSLMSEMIERLQWAYGTYMNIQAAATHTTGPNFHFNNNARFRKDQILLVQDVLPKPIPGSQVRPDVDISSSKCRICVE